MRLPALPIDPWITIDMEKTMTMTSNILPAARSAGRISSPAAGVRQRRVEPRIAYMMSRFPKITETFILYEMVELENRGVAVEVFPLLREKEETVHPEARRILPRVRFQPFLSVPIVAANFRALLRDPFRYVNVLAEVLWGTRASLNFFVGALGVFPKSVRMAEEMRDLGVTHIHAHFASHPALAALIIHRLTGLPFSFTAHGSDIHIDQTMFDRKLAAAAFAVTVCHYNVDFLAERFGEWVRDRLEVLPCGTDPEVFEPDATLERAAETSSSAPLAILCVAALREVKGHAVLIEACRRLHQRGIPFECRLVGDGPLRKDLARRIRDAGLEDRVTLAGMLPRPEVSRAMQAADVVVLPSILGSRGDREGIPVVLMEAMASARPVVSSRQSGIPELVDDGVSGVLCPPGDAEALADALQRLAEDPALRREMGAAGRRRILRDFDLRRNAARLAEMLGGSASSATVGQRADEAGA